MKQKNTPAAAPKAAELEKLDELRRDMPPGIEITEAAENQPPPIHLYSAILEVQTAIGPVRKDKENPHFKNLYSTLETIWETVHAAINKAGLIVIGVPMRRTFRTYVVHAKTGEQIFADLDIPAAATTPQAIGSFLTYARRYMLCAMLHIVSDDDFDDDGEAATNAVQKSAAAKPAPAAFEF